MKTLNSWLPREATLAAVLILPLSVQGTFSAPLRADDPKPKQGDVRLPLPGLGGDAGDPHVEMKRLFGKIENDLRLIDKLLAEASAGPGAGGTTESATAKTSAAVEGIDKLLASSEARGRSAGLAMAATWRLRQVSSALGAVV